MKQRRTPAERALSYLSSHPAAALSTKELARHLKITSREEFQTLRAAIEEMARHGNIAVDEHAKIRYVKQKARSKARRLTGTLRVTRKGEGYVRVEGLPEEVTIAPRFMRTALHGDTVVISLFARQAGRRGREVSALPQGEIVEVLQRGTTRISGKLEIRRTFAFVIPDDPRIPRDIYVSAKDAARARAGDKVVLELLPWDDVALNPEGKIIEVLGPAGDARVEVLSVARSYGLPPAFSAAVEREASRCAAVIPADEIRARRDLRSLQCVTIDPADARDHDDAVSLEHLPGGIFRLGVHIADVSYYVREGSLMDREALARGTSVYLVNEVVPMLPERLSADLCSLRPHEDRLAYSVLIDLAADGTMREHSFARTVIRSKRKFAYEEVQAILDKGKGEMADLLIPLNGIAKTLHAARMKRGSLDFESPEVKFAFDAQGLPVGIHKKPRLDAHRLIEECMLLANRVVAEHIGRLKTGGDGPPFLYRVHDLPDPSRLQDLARFVKHLGFSLDAKGGVSTRELQKLLERVRGTELEDLVNEVALRAMAKAVYSADNIGHFGLGFRHYTHFTSPIRRYPDLVVHRLLNLYTSGRVKPAGVAELRESLPAIALQSSDRERVAQEAERASVRVMQMEYMKRHVGDDFAGVITGVTDFGLFVELDDTLVQGLVRMRDLGDDYYIFDERQYALRGRSRGKVYRLGDRIRVRVVAVDPETRECDLALVEGRKRTF